MSSRATKVDFSMRSGSEEAIDALEDTRFNANGNRQERTVASEGWGVIMIE
jgi:hypothetical protein